LIRTARIVILNGVGSVGKSSIATALQSIATDPYLHLQMDAFMEMLPPAYQEHPDGFSYETLRENGNPLIVVKTGPVGARALRGMRHAVAAMAGQGNSLIVDDVFWEDEKAEYVELLSTFEVFFVGVLAPLDVFEARERDRGDRLLGLARWQYDKVHRGMSYDFVVDTSATSALGCAQLIKERFGL
jgi:chloramphenicol 3-O phosphotransferase